VGIIIVSRDQGPEKFSAAEETRVLRGVERALDWLVALEPRARVSFTYDIRRITITSPPGPYAGITEYPEKYEKGWRDETLGNMGYSDGRAGYQKYVTDLKTAKQTDWAYVAFFTKYELFHYAYSVWEKIVIDYRNDWLGPSQLHRTFAHETCHIFGAVDEDDETNCNCDGVSGHLEVPNKNCANCFSPDEQQAECVMNYYTMVMCEWSRKQIGWDVSLYPN
jgi:hypothetical protein